MTAEEFRKLMARVQERVAEIDRESYDAERNCYTMTRSDMYRKAAGELTTPDWCEILRVASQGWEYYSGE